MAFRAWFMMMCGGSIGPVSRTACSRCLDLEILSCDLRHEIIDPIYQTSSWNQTAELPSNLVQPLWNSPRSPRFKPIPEHKLEAVPCYLWWDQLGRSLPTTARVLPAGDSFATGTASALEVLKVHGSGRVNRSHKAHFDQIDATSRLL